MPNYRWTLTCEETYENGYVNTTTKTLDSDSETFTDVLVLLPQLFNGAGFRAELEDFEYKGVTFPTWAYESEKAALESLENDGSLGGFREAFDGASPPERWFENVDKDEEYVKAETVRLSDYPEYFPETRTDKGRPYKLAPDGVNRVYEDGATTLVHVEPKVWPTTDDVDLGAGFPGLCPNGFYNPVSQGDGE